MSTDDSIEEKRVYSDRAGKVEVFVATELGVVTVDVSGDRVGEFGLDHRCTARDVAAAGEQVAVATDEDIDLAVGDTEFEPTGFGPAVAIGFWDGRLVAANEDGWIARYDPDAEAGDVDLAELDAADADVAETLAWKTLGRIDTVRAIDGPLVAAADGVYRIDEDGVTHTGLDDVRDVVGVGVPLAATGEALYSLGNGWMNVLGGNFRAVTGDGAARAHAVAATTLYAREDDVSASDASGGPSDSSDGEWAAVELPTPDPVVGVAYATGAVVAVTEAGTLLVDAGDGWQSQELGVRGVAGLAVR
ncbi:hypothetical protein SAMN04487948_103222 [Halogranum amylolyticum]|uniref:HVO-0234-like beta-propeller domain-containing protein n=1 Tax=Halogranum amylolyticum TaxID=660520 RepID=A0A1H8QP94_9EURY|nr:hypothetical protein [Halogranum amylolyticum]SEO55811.1 hypothetical protein SAMN04487948_103222 [Halogranum amylolyticum]